MGYSADVGVNSRRGPAAAHSLERLGGRGTTAATESEKKEFREPCDSGSHPGRCWESVRLHLSACHSRHRPEGSRSTSGS